MQSIKLIVTVRAALTRKYSQAKLGQIDAAVGALAMADDKRGITTEYVEVDVPSSTKRHKVKAITGPVTAEKVKQAVDALVAKLRPDYIVLLGAGDIIPHFEVPNPTVADDGEPTVPTDNPYACSRPYVPAQRGSYLIPDRVVGRIPDLPSASDPSWLLDYLTTATEWESADPARYNQDLLLCADPFQQSALQCLTQLNRNATALMVSAPLRSNSNEIVQRHAALLQMFKCHGNRNDSRFFGQEGTRRPEVLSSRALLNRTKTGTVVGAMCCYGANLFDPEDSVNAEPKLPPIPSVYLRQGAFGFLGSTSTSYAGITSMAGADWIVTTFLRSVLSGASLGRAALEAKQDFVRWLQQQGDIMDAMDEKTLLQFVLLGDPSIHPVRAKADASRASAGLMGATGKPAAIAARRQRRAARAILANSLAPSVPRRERIEGCACPAELEAVLSERALEGGNGFHFDFTAARVERVITQLGVEPGSGIWQMLVRLFRGQDDATGARESMNYRWTSERVCEDEDAKLREIKVVSVQTDGEGNVLRSRVLISA